MQSAYRPWNPNRTMPLEDNARVPAGGKGANLVFLETSLFEVAFANSGAQQKADQAKRCPSA
jgi:hypothetical protein